MKSTMLTMGLAQLSATQVMNEFKLEEIREAYANSVNLPRKKKKQFRKKLIFDYDFFSNAGRFLSNFGL